MYDSKTEAIKDSFYTARALFMGVAFIGAIFLFVTKDKAIIYLAIKLSQKNAIALHIGSKKISDYVMERHYRYEDVNRDSYVYKVKVSNRNSDDFLMIKNKNAINVFYSRWFPYVSSSEEKLKGLEGDFTVFYICGLITLLFFSCSIFFHIKILKLDR